MTQGKWIECPECGLAGAVEVKDPLHHYVSVSLEVDEAKCSRCETTWTP